MLSLFLCCPICSPDLLLCCPCPVLSLSAHLICFCVVPLDLLHQLLLLLLRPLLATLLILLQHKLLLGQVADLLLQLQGPAQLKNMHGCWPRAQVLQIWCQMSKEGVRLPGHPQTPEHKSHFLALSVATNVLLKFVSLNQLCRQVPISISACLKTRSGRRQDQRF